MEFAFGTAVLSTINPLLDRQHRRDKRVQPLCPALTANAGLGQNQVFLLNFRSAQSYPFSCVYLHTSPEFFLKKHNKLKESVCLEAPHATSALCFKKGPAPHRPFAGVTTLQQQDLPYHWLINKQAARKSKSMLNIVKCFSRCY